MAVTKFGKIYYADYHDAAGVRRRISLQTQNKLVAQQKFEELLRRRAAIKERIVIHISWDNFKEKLYHYMKMGKNEIPSVALDLLSNTWKKSINHVFCKTSHRNSSKESKKA